MKIPITLFALVLAAAAHAQPTLNFPANAPMPGTSYTLRYGPYMDPGAAGAAQTWDMSGLTTDSTAMIVHVDPADAVGNANFPGATVAETGDEASMFWRAAADGMYLVGSYAADPEGDVAIPYSDEGKYLPYPCTYQTSWTDDVAATFNLEDIVVERTGTINGMADGYGTLILPDATIPNVLRVRWVENTTDVTELFEMAGVYDSYLYFEAGRSYPLVQIVTSTVNILGNEVTRQFTQWYGDLSTVIEVNDSVDDQLVAWPNPARDQVTLELPGNLSGEIFVQFHDGTGKAAHNARYVSANGDLNVDLSGLAAGLYMITATDAEGDSSVVRLSVE